MKKTYQTPVVETLLVEPIVLMLEGSPAPVYNETPASSELPVLSRDDDWSSL